MEILQGGGDLGVTEGASDEKGMDPLLDHLVGLPVTEGFRGDGTTEDPSAEIADGTPGVMPGSGKDATATTVEKKILAKLLGQGLGDGKSLGKVSSTLATM